MEIRMGSGHFTDREFVEAFENCTLRPEWFHHADHIRLAWIYLMNYGQSAAEKRFRDGLVRLAAQFGVADKFHHTITVAWLRAVAARADASREQPFEAWLANHAELLDRNFLLQHYSEDRLTSCEARAGWVDPDRKPLPRMARQEISRPAAARDLCP